MKRFIERIRGLFSSHCPDCGATMKSEFFDMEIDRMVYKCKNCGKKWV